MSHKISRRSFIRTSGGVVLGVTWLGSLSGCTINSVDPIATGIDVPYLTPNESFYVKNGAELSVSGWSTPDLAAGSWRLAIDGAVANPMTLSLADITGAGLAPVHLLKTMRCVVDSNDVQGLIGTAVWTGYPLRPFLEQAGIDLGTTKRLRLYGADRFTNNLVIDRVFGAADNNLVEPLIVTEMNGEPLPRDHGFPVRLIVHESFGYMNVKWLERIEATSNDSVFGTYQDAGFVDQGVMQPVSRVTSPLENAQVPAGSVVVSGFAVSGEAPIDIVEVSVDGGPFQAATIRTESEVLGENSLLADALQVGNTDRFSYPWRGVWAKWSFEFQASVGLHTIQVRATDASGNSQPQSDTDISDGINAELLMTVTAG